MQAPFVSLVHPLAQAASVFYFFDVKSAVLRFCHIALVYIRKLDLEPQQVVFLKFILAHRFIGNRIFDPLNFAAGGTALPHLSGHYGP